VLQTATVNIPAGTSAVTLNFNLTPGTSYQLGTNTAQNNTSFGYASPRLERTQSGVAYPYTVANYVSITNANNGGTSTPTAYYYFYNWKIEVLPDAVCTSERTAITVYVTSGAGIEPVSEYGLTLYPNPAEDHVNVQFTMPSAGNVSLCMTDMLGRTLLSRNLGEVSGTYTQSLSTSGLAAGVYKISITVKEKTFHSLVVVK
jgi:hypothetical protein